MPPSPEIEERPGDVLSVVVISNDTMLAALPAHPVQLAYGCHLLGYHTVVPASWGDELVASAILRDAEQRGRRPAIICACERARARLTTGAGELIPFLISTIAPPVATARYLRALWAGRRLDITLVGDCVSGADPVFDARYTPDVFLTRLRSAGIDLRELPMRFKNLMPPDRRRHVSLPGGCPTAEALASRCPDRQLVELTDDNLAIELAQQLFEQNAVLLDIAPGVGCSCAGVRGTGSARTARVAVTSLEPPRSLEPIVNDTSLTDLSAECLPPVKLALLPRDPDSDLVQSLTTAARPSDVEAPVGRDRDVTPALRHRQTADLAPSSWESAPNVTSRSRRPFAITPPYALQAVSFAPRNAAVSGQVRRTAGAPPATLTAAADASSAPTVEPRAPEVIGQPLVAPETGHAVEGGTEAAHLHLLVEDPLVAAQRAAQDRIRAHIRHVPPPPNHKLLRNVGLWGTVIVAAILLAIAIIARSL